MNKILVFYEYAEVKKKFSENFNKKEVSFLRGDIQDYKNKKDFEKVEILSVFISSILDKKNIDKFPNLKLILTRSTGTDHIDLDYAKSKGIEVQNIRDYGAVSVAEYSIALLFEISKKITLANLEVRENYNFSARGIHKIESFDLAGKTMGVIGTGAIGKNLVKISKGLSMNVLVFDKFKDEKWAKKEGVEYVSFDKLLKKSDIISLHLPLLKSTRHILGEREFKKMKDGVVILNTARGGLIDTKALYKNLKSGKIFAGGFDVLENEDCLGRENHKNDCDGEIKKINKKIIKLENAIITPHNAFNSREASKRRIEMSVEKIREFLELKK